MPKLYVKCKNCGFEFATPLWMVVTLHINRKSLESVLPSNNYKCPKCGATEQYNKEDYHFLRE